LNNKLLQNLLPKPIPQTTDGLVNALREILQSMALLGLWRSHFFEHAAFYGGTALRILYGLPRYSEDLDFSLLNPNPDFDFNKYISALQTELNAYGFIVQCKIKNKTNQTAIQSAFLKTNTYAQILTIQVPEYLIKEINKQTILKIKLEIDTNPPLNFSTEMKYVFTPLQFAVRTYDLPSLFAGKLHALLCRKWKNRVKGRDWYDFVWYISNYPTVNLKHLETRMQQSGHFPFDKILCKAELINMLNQSIENLDIGLAIKEVIPFLENPKELEIWSKDFFHAASNQIEFE
jgi:predicted nucleotidyltransferase component of viral defense system